MAVADVLELEGGEVVGDEGDGGAHAGADDVVAGVATLSCLGLFG